MMTTGRVIVIEIVIVIVIEVVIEITTAGRRCEGVGGGCWGSRG